ncbi:hypothetical protein [Propionivibrio dicarboxylicus]|uniref:Uncharacterized protein n=1 Tax=Propionivibrio dicarboxylicus TaxID=83767 RepID=A0A1G8APN5_9RHOO|nr:hypothetical protein [Propionivibrio dicarboxylicus]SDH22971.1 hypothetical protein SAMN05660652_01458 [Propionivibrio dicarboxylicus]
MADEKKVESTVITLVAVERGFYDGALVEPGAQIAFDTVGSDGKTCKLPKWAAKPGDPRLSRPKPKAAGDLKPKAAQSAVKNKSAALAGGDLVG